MSDILFEGLKVAGLLALLLLTAGILWALVLGLWRSVTGEANRQSDRVAKAWVDGWNAAMRGDTADADEWARRMEREFDR